MGRTFRQYSERDDEGFSSKKKNLKHSRNIPGKGMRVLNEYDEFDDDLDDDQYDDESYNDNTSQYNVNRSK